MHNKDDFMLPIWLFYNSNTKAVKTMPDVRFASVRNDKKLVHFHKITLVLIGLFARYLFFVCFLFSIATKPTTRIISLQRLYSSRTMIKNVTTARQKYLKRIK